MAFMKSQLCLVLLLAVICAVTAEGVSIADWRKLLKDTVEYKEWCDSTTNQAYCSEDDNTDICSDKFLNLVRAMRKLHRSQPVTSVNVAYDPEICSVEKTDVAGITRISTTAATEGTSSTTTPQGTSSSTTPQGTSSSTTPQGRSSTTIPQGTSSSTTPQGRSSTTTSQGSSSTTTSQGSSSTTTSQGSSSTTIPQGTSSSTTPQGTSSSTTTRDQDASTSQRSNSSSTNATELVDAEGNGTPGVPESSESNHLYWVLPVITILLIAMVVGGIYIFRYTKKAGYHHSSKSNGEAAKGTGESA